MTGYEKFLNEIREIVSNTEKEMSKKTKKDNETTTMEFAITMLKQMVNEMAKYVSKEAKENTSFAEALSFEWKSAERMLKYVFSEAKKLAIPTVSRDFCCMVPDDKVFDWINEYYALDDKKEIEEELKKAAEAKAEAEEKAKKEEELKAKAREKAIEKLSQDAEFNNLSEEEKEKKISRETYTIKSRLEAAEKRKKKAAEKKEAKVKESQPKKTDADNNDKASESSVKDEKEGEGIKAKANTKKAVKNENTASEKPPVVTGTQFSLFDLL